jgi:hypothetical protein
VLSSGQKLALGLLDTIILEVAFLCKYTLFLVLLPFIKHILEVVFYEGVQRHLRFCLNHLSSVKMVAFLVGDDSHIFGKKFPGEV